MKEEYIELKLPLPISVNIAYSNAGKKRIKSEEYKDWLSRAWFEMKSQTKYTIKGDNWLFAEYTYYMPIFNDDGSKKVVDTENRAKALSDFLASTSGIKGFKDHKILTLVQTKVNSEENIVRVKIKEI